MLDSSKGFNTLSFEHSQVPSIQTLIAVIDQFKPLTLSTIAKTQINIKIKPELLAILTIPLG